MYPLIQKDAPLSPDPREARANLIARLRGDVPYIGLKADMEALAARNRSLVAGGSHAVREALADQIPLIEAVAMRFFNDAAKAGNSNARQALAGVALSAQKTLIANLLALHRVTQDEADSKAIPIQHTQAD